MNRNSSNLERAIINKIKFSKLLSKPTKNFLTDKTRDCFDDYYCLKSDYNAGKYTNFYDLNFSKSSPIISNYMYDTLECVVGGCLAYKDKVNYSKIKYVCDSYNYKLSYFNSPRIDTYKKASLLLTSIIDNNVIDDEDRNIEFAFNVASRMCAQPFQYTGINNMIPKKLERYESIFHFYELDLQHREYFKKCVKVWEKEWIEKQREGINLQDTIEYACKFEEILKFFHEYCCLKETSGYHKIRNDAHTYDTLFKDNDNMDDIESNLEQIPQKKKSFFSKFKK